MVNHLFCHATINTDVFTCDKACFFRAEKLSRYFGSYLEEHYDLEDHRKDPEYSSWNEDVQKYQNAEKNAIRKIEVILEYLRKKKQK